MKSQRIFYWSAAISIMIAAWGVLGNTSFHSIVQTIMNTLQENFTWLYLWGMFALVIFCMVLAFSPLGKIRLGENDDRPEYPTISWFAMLFGAGMGIGLVFWGVAEPLSHYLNPISGVVPQSEESALFAMRSSFMHWGIHPWACYAVMGLGLAYFQFRKHSPAMASSLLQPFFYGKKHKPFFDSCVDIYTTVLTAIGVATSFGMGCLQICSGLNDMFGIPDNAYVWIILIIAICFVYLRNAITGVEKGIKLLSNINLVLFVLLLLLAFSAGSLISAFTLGGQGLSQYIFHFLEDSVKLSQNGDSSWIQNWRVFYWAWWLSWAPFVGIFIARISKGRTIREFIFGVIFVPTVVSILWFTAFGSLTLSTVRNFSVSALEEMTAKPEIALFQIIRQYPFGMVLGLLAVALLVTFFITSANSATFVLAMLTSNGDLCPSAPRKIFWGVLIAVLAFALILSGGISMIQTVSIVIAFPYLFILLAMCASIILSLLKDYKK